MSDDLLKPGRDLLPTSVPKMPKNTVYYLGQTWIHIACASCGCDGGMIPEDTKDFAYFLCDVCSLKYSPDIAEYAVPDDVFFERVKQTQLEKYGRELTAEEILRELDNPESPLSKLARSRRDLPEYRRRS